MRDPDDWLEKGVHWHAYVEIRDGSELFPSVRAQRMRWVPDAVIHAPEGVVDWIARLVRQQSRPDAIRLIGPGGGNGRIGDEAHIEHDRDHDLDSACRGDSIYTDITREHDRMHLWVEALTESECSIPHSPRDEG